jgi:cytochrome oxidase Cu insertion factor (SCO1/SenC/PrrC family)
MLRRTVLTAVTVLSAVALSAQSVTPAPAPQVDIAALGPRVGDKPIDFSLADQTGKIQTLKTVAGPKGTMLVFFRSADW